MRYIHIRCSCAQLICISVFIQMTCFHVISGSVGPQRFTATPRRGITCWFIVCSEEKKKISKKDRIRRFSVQFLYLCGNWEINYSKYGNNCCFFKKEQLNCSFLFCLWSDSFLGFLYNLQVWCSDKLYIFQLAHL